MRAPPSMSSAVAVEGVDFIFAIMGQVHWSLISAILRARARRSAASPLVVLKSSAAPPSTSTSVVVAPVTCIGHMALPEQLHDVVVVEDAGGVWWEQAASARRVSAARVESFMLRRAATRVPLHRGLREVLRHGELCVVDRLLLDLRDFHARDLFAAGVVLD